MSFNFLVFHTSGGISSSPPALLFLIFRSTVLSSSWVNSPILMSNCLVIILAYGLSKETVAAMMILYRNTKVKVHSPDGNTDYFDIIAGVLQGDTLAPYLFIICLDYVLRRSIDKIKENGFELIKKRSRRYPAKTITDADYAGDRAILANSPAQPETLLHSLERAASMSVHTKRNICALMKQATFPHETIALWN